MVNYEMTRKKSNLLTITPESWDRSFSTSARASRMLASIPALATPVQQGFVTILG